jgi:hypothetical protein
MDDLRRYLATIPPGEISDTDELQGLLAECWDDLMVTEGGMKAYKLMGRMEQVSWTPPDLHFEIERHGAAMLGSTRAEVQRWTVNVETGTASLRTPGRRQLYPMSPRLNVEPMTEEIAQFIVNRERDERLKWYEDGHVRVLIGKIIPSEGPQETLLKRRRRFRISLTKRLTQQGWKEIHANSYGPSEGPKQIGG